MTLILAPNALFHDVDAALSKTDYDAEHQAISVEMVPFHFCETHQNTSVSHSFTISLEFMSVSISFYLLETGAPPFLAP